MSKTGMWMPLDIGDYLADTMHLNGAQHGAYLLLIMHYWCTGPLRDDDAILAAIARTELRVWKRDIGPVVRQFFIRKSDGLLHQKRADAELARAEEISQKRRQAALSRYAMDTSELSSEGCKSTANASEINGSRTERTQSHVSNKHVRLINLDISKSDTTDEDGELLADPPKEAKPLNFVDSAHANAGVLQEQKGDFADANGLQASRARARLPLPLPKNIPNPSDWDATSASKPDARTLLFREGRPALRRMVGVGERQAGGILGRLLKAAHDDCTLVLAVIRDAESLWPAEPMAWIMAAVLQRAAPQFKNGWLQLIANEDSAELPDDCVAPLIGRHSGAIH